VETYAVEIPVYNLTSDDEICQYSNTGKLNFADYSSIDFLKATEM
jgi:hypothetical protein